jgi:hypothetical protein
MRSFATLLVAPLLLLASACGAGQPGTAGGNAAPDKPATIATEPASARLYEGNGLVCENGARGPRLWLGGMRMMLGPPECGGIPLVGWDWEAVSRESTAEGKTWGSYHVVGLYDGKTLAVTNVGAYQTDSSVFGSDPDTGSPCAGPAGGWVVPHPAQNTQNDVGGAAAYARSQPDYVASWNTHLEPARLEFGPVVFNAVFTGDRARHEAEIRKVWDGPLCIVTRDVPTARELARVRREVEAGLGDLELEMLWSAGPDVEPTIEIGVVADIGGEAQAALDARYGPGVVRLIPALQPLP